MIGRNFFLFVVASFYYDYVKGSPLNQKAVSAIADKACCEAEIYVQHRLVNEYIRV